MGGRGSSSTSSARSAGMQKDHYDVSFKPSGFSDKYNPPYLYDEAVGFTANLLGVDKDKARELNSAVNDFTDRGYTTIRQFQRGEEVAEWARDGVERKSELLEEYINRAPKWGGGTTYRGVGSSRYGSIDAGDLIDMGGTSSWTTDIDTAISLGGTSRNSLIVFVSGTQRKGTSVRHLAKNKPEDEVTVSKSAKYEVVSVTEKKYTPPRMGAYPVWYDEVMVRELR